MAYRHIVLFRIHDDVREQEAEAAEALLRGLEVLPEVQEWRILRSLDDRKGRVLIEDATFADRRAFERFRTSAEHAEVAEQLARIADWLVGDYVV